ncbi:putative protein TPRXL [Lates japonicus]|uniref:Uncharacterized protein n=1 Tax=Lates japonicus TaxID=270547 RepID=A0AAD3MMG1_LATJO|nr:putative protein TPRXL [Lates japonicus]
MFGRGENSAKGYSILRHLRVYIRWLHGINGRDLTWRPDSGQHVNLPVLTQPRSLRPTCGGGLGREEKRGSLSESGSRTNCKLLSDRSSCIKAWGRPACMLVTTNLIKQSDHYDFADYKCQWPSELFILANRERDVRSTMRGLAAYLSNAESPKMNKGSTAIKGTVSPAHTSVITGHDPLGWKLQPKSSSTSPRARTNRLSLQIPLPVIFPDPESSPDPTSKSDNTPNQDLSPKTKPPLKPKPSRRRHSDSSAFLRSSATPLPVVTLEELCAVHLRQVTHSDESDNVFSEENEEEVKVTTQPRKIPPPVPEKTSMARQIAQLIAHSWQCHTPVTTKTKDENIYASVMKPKPKQTVQRSSLHAKKMGLRLDTSCDRESSTPRFPGREI